MLKGLAKLFTKVNPILAGIGIVLGAYAAYRSAKTSKAVEDTQGIIQRTTLEMHDETLHDLLSRKRLFGSSSVSRAQVVAALGFDPASRSSTTK